MGRLFFNSLMFALKANKNLFKRYFSQSKAIKIEHKPIVKLPSKDEEIKEEKKLSDGRLINIIGLTRNEIEFEFEHFNVPKYKTMQVFQWLYSHGVQSFDEMNNIGKPLIEKLKNHFYISHGKVTSDLISSDGTRKWLLEIGNKQYVESSVFESIFFDSFFSGVFIPETKRGTLCVSSQIGCTFSCSFCHTGTQPLVRNLKAEEIIGQVLSAKSLMFDFPKRKERILSNLVFMGQGEPFYNYKQVKKTIDIITDSAGISISKRRITVSTSGIVPNIERLGKDFPGINLAISLHAVNDELRSKIVPANRQWPIKELLNACKKFPSNSANRRIAFEYVMLNDVNDSPTEARELVRLLKGIPSFVNIIPFNPWPGSEYQSSNSEKIIKFSKIVQEGGIDAPIRWPRGRDILAACGQLKTESTKEAQISR